MQVAEWSKSEVKYGRRVLNSGLEGVRFGQQAFLHGGPASPFLRESLRKALIPAALGVCLGVLTACPAGSHRWRRRLLLSGVIGGLVGATAGVLWETRYLAATVTGAAVARIGRARDEHWLERNPIDYA